MRRRRGHWWLIAAISAFAVGCATRYQKEDAIHGGYTDTRITNDTVLVTFRGNVFTSTEKTRDLLLYRCAEVTVADGFDYFVINPEDPKSARESANAASTPHGTSKYAVGLVQPNGPPAIAQKPRVEALIRMFKGKMPANDPTAIDAQEVIRNLGPQSGLPGE